VDESGDVGFERKSSNVFVIGYLVTDSQLRLSCELKKLRRRLFERLGIEIREFKFHDDRDFVRLQVLGLMARSDVTCGFVAVNKEAVVQRLREMPEMMYNYLAVNYPIRSVVRKYRPDRIDYIIDKQTWSKERRTSFNQYIQNKAQWVSMMECGSLSSPSVVPAHKSSHDDPCLQAADYVAGAVYAMVNKKDRKFFDIIKAKFPPEWQEVWDLPI